MEVAEEQETRDQEERRYGILSDLIEDGELVKIVGYHLPFG